MSRDTKRSWNDEVEEAGLNNVNEDSKPNSRENSNCRKKTKPNSENKPSKPKKTVELEIDPGVLQRRQKQIDYGKNTVGYANYTQLVPTDQRTKDHPMTPDKYTKYSRRAWDMLIKIWRKKLHEFDTEQNNDGGGDDDDNDDDDSNADEETSDKLYSLF